MNKKAKIWCLVPALLIVFLTVGPAVARDQVIGTWCGAPGVSLSYIDPISSPHAYATNVIYNEAVDYKYFDIAAGDIEGVGKVKSDRIVSRWPNGLWIYNIDYNSWRRGNTKAPKRVTVGNLGQDERLEIIGTYGTGIFFFYWNGSGWLWRRITSYVPIGDIAAGDIDGDGWDEVVAEFPSGIWYWNPAKDRWYKITSYRAYHLAVGDMNGDGRAEVSGAFPTGIWSWDHGTWRRLTGSGFATDGDIAFGDFDGNGKDDLVTCWHNTHEIWVLWDNGKWELTLPLGPPWRVTTGKIRD